MKKYWVATLILAGSCSYAQASSFTVIGDDAAGGNSIVALGSDQHARSSFAEAVMIPAPKVDSSTQTASIPDDAGLPSSAAMLHPELSQADDEANANKPLIVKSRSVLAQIPTVKPSVAKAAATSVASLFDKSLPQVMRGGIFGEPAVSSDAVVEATPPAVVATDPDAAAPAAIPAAVPATADPNQSAVAAPGQGIVDHDRVDSPGYVPANLRP